MSYENSMSPADYAAVNNGGGFGGNNGLEWLIVLFLFGWGRGGWGGGNGSCGSGSTCATPADVTQAVDRQTFIGKLDGLTYGITDATYALNNSLMQGFHGVDRELCGISREISDCCCMTQRGIDGVNFNLAKGLCDLGNAINMQTRDLNDTIRDGFVRMEAQANARYISDLERKLNACDRDSALQGLGTYLVNTLRPTAIPSYPVANPYCCQPACGGCGNGFGYGG